MTEERRSPLEERHLASGAKLAAFGGWQMPREYPLGVLKEHAAVRESVGAFDVSHLGKVLVQGPDAVDHLNQCLTNDLRRIGPGEAQYTLACRDDGGIIDDLIAYVHDDDRVLLVPNAANSDELVGKLRDSMPSAIEVLDQHEDYALIAVQGPRSVEVLERLGLPTEHPFMSFVVAAPSGLGSSGEPREPREPREVVVCRSGYTGERGYELLVPADEAVAVWDAVVDETAEPVVQPCGLGARDTLRTEMGYPLHGQDISPEVTPVQARMSWAVGWSKPEFWGREALLEEKERGPARRLRGLVARGRGIPRPGMTVRSGDSEVGAITSGTFSPTLRTGVGMALLAAEVSDGDEVSVEVRGRPEVFEVRKPPFVDPSVRD